MTDFLLDELNVFGTKPYAEYYLRYPAILENGDAAWMRDMANTLVGLENMNAITVNWKRFSTGRYECALKKYMPTAGTSIFYFFLPSEVRGVFSEPCQTSMMNLFGKNSEWLSTIDYFRQ